ncbi:thiol-disulfide oxidoreductase DCC family protein [Algicella marina]|uniref:DUF393 domain-containing protein n=1 Tax=Algicella marina TaxID=2683284 RepID=A0A6P1SW69_9RHOB|nr:DCC1-like thiol-disulfide oxidoreductase family protein [Algicella marina]QHQ33900.1 DUF393 domain-containing protein [Algicella marina]
MPTPVTGLSADLRRTLANNDLIVFDGNCVLCSRFFRFILRHDRQQRFRFATAQGQLGQRLYSELGLPLDDFETNLVLTGGQIHQNLDAFAAAMTALGWPWRALGLLRHLPGLVKAPLYHLVARNRYRIFGRRSTCLVPEPSLRARFMDTV